MALLGTLRPDAPCKICNGATELQGCVDAGRSCETQRGVYLPLTGIPIYYHRCLLCGFLFTTAFDTWSPEQFRANIYNDQYRIADPDYATGSRARGNAPITASIMDQLQIKRVLDFGGGDGTLATELTALGYDAHSWDPIADLTAESPVKSQLRSAHLLRSLRAHANADRNRRPRPDHAHTTRQMVLLHRGDGRPAPPIHRSLVHRPPQRPHLHPLHHQPENPVRPLRLARAQLQHHPPHGGTLTGKPARKLRQGRGVQTVADVCDAPCNTAKPPKPPRRSSTMQTPLIDATELARQTPIRFPNESPEYRAARTALLAEEITLRRHIEAVAAQRRALPPGGEVRGDYQFHGEGGPADFPALFTGKQTLAIYSFMFGPERDRPCPMCTALLGPLDGNAADLRQKIALAVVARSPVARLTAFAKERGWQNLPFYTDLNDHYSRDYFGLLPDGSEIPAFNIFTRQNNNIQHFWSGEMSSSDPGQDPRGAPDLSPLWNVLDMTPEGRGTDWYPKLNYRE